MAERISGPSAPVGRSLVEKASLSGLAPAAPSRYEGADTYEDFMVQQPAGMVLEAMTVGLAAEQLRTVTPSDLADFADVSGDRNPLHMDEDYAEASPFRGRVAHGMLLGAWISALLGEKLPGPGAIYVSQSLTFKRPVRIGDEVLTRAEVSEVDLKAGHVRLSTRCSVQGKTVLEGEAILRAPRAAPRSR